MRLTPLLTLLVAGIVLSSCIAPPPNPDAEGMQSYNSKKSPQTATIPDDPYGMADEAEPVQLDSQTTQPEKQTQLGQLTQSKGSMKTLQDFEVIKASQVTLTTTKGDITFTLYQDQVPVTAANFLSLAKSGHYDGIVFHRVIADFMAQVGDPNTKEAGKEAMWGQGGPGYVIPDEFVPELKHDTEGVVSMANAGPGTGGSQFFITYEPTPWLDGKHTVFGKVTQGMDVLRQITVGDKIVSVSYQ